MDTATAFAIGEANRDQPLMVFDWDKAARIILSEGAKDAQAGLSQDWEWTGGNILVDGSIPEDSYTYLASTWARPQLDIDGYIYDCWRYQDGPNDWHEKTFWPESARQILESIEVEASPAGPDLLPPA